MEKEEVKISVRDIVEFILRSGDIDNRRGGWADKESLAKGTRIHKKIQRQMGAAYQAEVPLSYRFCYEDLDILVEGRADGIEEKEDHVMVDEIKGVHRREESEGRTGYDSVSEGRLYCSCQDSSIYSGCKTGGREGHGGITEDSRTHVHR